MNKKQTQSEQTKKRVASAARALFAQKGYKATSIEDLVAATGCSKGNIYYHFKSKEGLFLHLIDEWDMEWEQKWLEKESQYPTATEKLYALTELLVEEDFNHPLTKAADEFFNLEEKTNEVDRHFNDMLARHLLFNQRLIQEGIDRGEFKPDLHIEHLAILWESIFFGLNQISRRTCKLDEALTLYRTAIRVLLGGMAVAQEQSDAERN